MGQQRNGERAYNAPMQKKQDQPSDGLGRAECRLPEVRMLDFPCTGHAS
jgi:hypothetical protein